MTIYVDVLLVLNIYVNYLLLMATAKLRHLRLTFPRCILSSLFGSLFSLAIFIPAMNIVTLNIFKIFSAFLIVIATFGFGNFLDYFKNTLFFFAVNFVFAGAVYALMLAINSSATYFNNACLYIDLSPVTLVVGTAIAYFSLGVIRRIFGRSTSADGRYSVIVSFGGRTVSLSGIADTGNTLTDVFSGLPVIICDSESLGVSGGISAIENIRGARILPYSTIGNDGFITVFTPVYVCVKNETSNRVKQVSALIGISEKHGEYEAIFNPKILV